MSEQLSQQRTTQQADSQQLGGSPQQVGLRQQAELQPEPHYELICEDLLIYATHVRFKNLGDGVSNSYLIHDAGEWLMVDAGAPGKQSYHIMRESLEEIGVDLSKLKLFLTHQHFDHSGQANDILLPGTPIYGSRIGFESRRAPAAAEIDELFFRRMLAMGASPADAQAYEACNRETIFIDEERFDIHPVQEGDTITVGNRTLSVYETPGHSPDSLVLFDKDSGILFSGDHVLTITTPAIDSFFTGEDGYERYLESLQKVQKLEPQLVLPGHGSPIKEGFSDRIDEIIDRKSERRRAVLRAIAAHPYCMGETVARLCSKRPDPDQWYKLPAVARYYLLLEAFVMIQTLVAHGIVQRMVISDDGIYRLKAASGF